MYKYILWDLYPFHFHSEKSDWVQLSPFREVQIEIELILWMCHLLKEVEIFNSQRFSTSCKFEKLTHKPFPLFLLSSLNSSFCSNLVAGEKTGLAFLASDWCCWIKSIIIYHCISMIAGVWNNIHPIRCVPNLDFNVQQGISSADWIWTQAWLAAGCEPGSLESSDQQSLQPLSLPY